MEELTTILKKKGYRLTHLSKEYIEGVKKLSRIGSKRRFIYFLIKPMKFYGINEAKGMNKVFNKRKPSSLSTFYFYNLVPISEEGYSDEAIHYTATKMMDSWNLRPLMPWDIFLTSYTKITHLVSIKHLKILYPLDPEVVKKYVHKEVIDLFTELMKRLEMV